MRLIHGFVLLSLVTLVPLANPGCSKYGEGSPCSVENTDPVTHISDDCQDGLVCTLPNLLQICSDSAICCPPTGQTVNNPACIPGAPQCGAGQGGGGSTPTSEVGGFGGSPMCAHDQCVEGVALDPGTHEDRKSKEQVPNCTQCVIDICNGKDGVPGDSTCCTHTWDIFCVQKVESVCSVHCGSGGSGGTGGTGGTGATSSGGGGTKSSGGGGTGGAGGT